MRLKFLFLLAILSFGFLACEKDQSNLSDSSIEKDWTKDQLITSGLTNDVVLTKEQSNALIKSGINALNDEEIPTSKKVKLFGNVYEGYAMNDLFITKGQLDNMTIGSSDNSLLSASTNRVSLPSSGKRLIRVGAISNGVDALSENLLFAAYSAVLNYQNLNLNKLNFQFVVITEAEANAGTDGDGPIDIIIFVDSQNNFVGNGDGRATFPNNGNTGPFFGLSTNTANYSFKNNTILIMHEMGHTLGMAHADFLTRRSCGNTDPLDPELGDLLGVANVTEVCNIAGTDDSGDFLNSIMRACGFFVFPSASFTSEDVSSFTKLYSQVEIPCAGDDNGEEEGGDDCVVLSQATINYIINVYGINFLNQLIALGYVCPI